MKQILIFHLIFISFLIAACNTGNRTNETTQKNESLFPKGEKLESDNFTGTVWLQMMGAKDTTLHARFGNVTFEPKARTNWHSHPGGQLLFITSGKGYYQAKGKPARTLQAQAMWWKSHVMWCTGMVLHPTVNLHTLPSVLTRMRVVRSGLDLLRMRNMRILKNSTII